MESARGSERLFPDSYGPAATPMFRPPVKINLHRPFEDQVTRRPTDTAADAFTSYLQYPEVHSTAFPLLMPTPSFQHHRLSAFQQLYQQQRMRSEAVAMSQAAKDEMELMRSMTDRTHDDSRGEDDDRSRSPDSPTQLTGDEDADGDDATASHQTSSPAANKCESLLMSSYQLVVQ